MSVSVSEHYSNRLLKESLFVEDVTSVQDIADLKRKREIEARQKQEKQQRERFEVEERINNEKLIAQLRENVDKLQRDLKKEKEDHNRDVQKLEDDLKKEKGDLGRDILKLEGDLKKEKEDHKRDVTKLEGDLKKEKEDHNRHATKLEGDLKKEKEDHKRDVTKLEGDLKKEKEDHNRDVTKLEGDLKNEKDGHNRDVARLEGNVKKLNDDLMNANMCIHNYDWHEISLLSDYILCNNLSDKDYQGRSVKLSHPFFKEPGGRFWELDAHHHPPRGIPDGGTPIQLQRVGGDWYLKTSGDSYLTCPNYNTLSNTGDLSVSERLWRITKIPRGFVFAEAHPAL